MTNIVQPDPRDSAFEKLDRNWLTWAALRHFLPAKKLRTLAQVVTRRLGQPGISLSDIFEEVVLQDDTASQLSSWVLIPRSRAGADESYLKSRIRAWANQSDFEIFVQGSSDGKVELKLPAHSLEAASLLGSADFTSLPGVRPAIDAQGDDAILGYESLLATGPYESSEAALTDFESRFRDISLPLKAVLAKHVGDLYADLDEWTHADWFYQTALNLLDHKDSLPPMGIEDVLRDITLQSIAAANWCLQGPAQAHSFLQLELNPASLRSHSTLALNGPLDAMVALNSSSESFSRTQDSRGEYLPPPQLASSHNLSIPLSYLRERHFAAANRAFWGVLRRQLALGLTVESRETKFCYGQALFAELESASTGLQQVAQIPLGVRLLLESGDASGIEKMEWAPDVTRRFVTEELVRDVLARVKRYEGVRLERSRAALELFRHWLAHVEPGNTAVLEAMLGEILAHARDSQASFFSNRDLGTRAFEILETLAKLRPEFRETVSGQFAQAFATRMAGANIGNVKSKALEAALYYMDALRSEDLIAVVESTLALLSQMVPAKNVWILVQPALRLLVCKASASLARASRDIGERMLNAILRFGAEQDTESAALLFYLQAFDAALLHDPEIIEAARPAIEKVRLALKQINSTATVRNIQSILLVPAIAGREILDEAFLALRKVIASSPGRSPSISFGYAYDAVLQVSDKREALATAPGSSPEQAEAWLSALFSDIVSLWSRAKENPMTFASFSLPPPTVPNLTIVHNWAYASMRLASDLKRVSEMERAVRQAEVQPQLKQSVAVGIAVSEVSAGEFNLVPVPQESRDFFYSVLGRRLLGVRALDAERGRAVCLGLLHGCFRHGPNGMDAAVFVTALDLELQDSGDARAHRNYILRVDSDRELRLVLIPLLRRLLPEQEE